MKKHYTTQYIKSSTLLKYSKFIFFLMMVVFFLPFHKTIAQGTTCGGGTPATPLTINGACDSGTISSTIEDVPLISGCSAGTFRREGWYTFTVAGGPLNVTITGITTNRNLYLQLISSTAACTGLVQIACANANNTNNSGQTETINATLNNGIYYVKVVNAGTSNNDMNLTSLCITAVPTITSFTPNNGCANSTTVVITGTNFTGVTAVRFGGTNAASFTVNSSTQITATVAAGASGAITAVTPGGTATSASNFTVNPNVGTPVFSAGATSTRCQGAGIVTYTATATNNTGLTYSLDATSLASGNSIVSGTGAVTYAAGWSGTSIITLSAAGCNGPTTANHTVIITPTVGTPTAISIAAGTEPTCQLPNGTTTTTYATTSSNNTSFNWSLSNPAAGSINSSGIMTWSNGFSGTVAIQVTANGCNGPTSPAVIRTVIVTPNNTVGAASSTPTLCINTALTAITHTTTTATAIANDGVSGANGLPAGVSATWASNTITISGTPIGSGVFNYNILLTGGCGSINATGIITVENPVVAAGIIAGTPTVCQGESGVSYSVPAIANATGYTWTLPSGATIATGTNTNLITVNFSSLATSGNITVSGTNACGNGIVSANYAVTVNSLPDAAGTIVGTSTVCQGQNGVAYSVPAIANVTGYTWSLPAGATIASGTNTNSITIDFDTSAVSGIITVQGTNACGNGIVSANYAVTVNTLSVAPTSISGATIICEGNSTTLTLSGGNAGTGATAEWFSDSCGGTAAGTGNSISVSPIIDTTYYVRFTGTCNTTSCVSVTITVDPLALSAGIISGTATVCQGQSGVTYSVPAITNATSYIWSLPSGASIVSGANTDTIIVDFSTSALSGDVTVQGTNACGSGIVSANYAVTVNPLPANAGTITGSATFCQGQNGVSYSVPAIANATDYVWSLPSGATIASGSNTDTITVDFNTSAVSGNITVLGTNACGSGIISANFPVTVNTLSIAPTSITGAAIICEGTSTTLSVSGGTAGTAAVAEWFSDSCGGTAAGTGNSISISPIVDNTYYVRYVGTCNTTTCSSLSITVDPLPIAAGSITGTPTVCQGQTGVSFSVPAIANATDYTWTLPSGASIATGTNTNLITVNFSSSATSGNITVSGTNACGSGIVSANYAVTVDPLPANAGTITGSATVCQGQNGVTYSVPAIANAANYVWSLPSGTTIASGNNTNAITIDFNTSAVSGNITVQGTNACGSGIISANFPVTVNPLPLAAGIISGTPTVCQGQSGLVYTIPAITHATGYTWVLPSGASITAGANTNTITVVFSTLAVSGNITVLGTNGCGNGIISANFPVIVNPLPANAGTITGPSIVCQGDIGVVYSVPVIANALNYIWTLPPGATITSGANTETITVNYSLAASSGIVTVKGNNACGDGIISANYAVTVNITPSITLNYSPTVCSEELVTVSPANGGGNIVPLGTTYSWGLPTVTGGITGATALNIQTNFNQTLTNPTNTTQTASYNVTATTGGCSATTFSVLVTVYPKPTVSGTPLTQPICSGEAIAPITFSNPNGVAGTIDYNWTRDNTGNVTGMAASGSGSSITGNLSNATTSPQTTVFSVIATTEDGCNSLPFTVSVVVNPIPTVAMTPATNQTICSDDSITPITISNPNGVIGTTYSWTRTNTANINGIPDGSGATILGSLTNTTNIAQTTIFTIKATADGCDSSTTTVSITVNPKPTVAVSTLTQSVCGGTAIASVVISNPNSVAGTNYNWTRDNTTNLSGMVNGVGTPVSGTMVNNTNSNQTTIFTVTAAAGTCFSNTTTTVIVRPTPTIAITNSNQTICSTTAILPMGISNPNNVAGTTYTWTRNNTTFVTGIANSGNSNVPFSITGTLLNNQTTTQITTFTITATAANGCSSTSIATVTVYAPLVAPVIGTNQTACLTSTPNALTITTLATGGSGTFSYQWQRSTDNVTYNNIGGATNNTYQPAAIPLFGATSTYYRLIVTNTCGNVTSNFIVIQPANNGSITTNYNNLPGNLCPGSSFTPTVISSHFSFSAVRFGWTANAAYVTPANGGPIGSTGAAYFFGIFRDSSASIGPLTVQNNTNATVISPVVITPYVYDYNATGAIICTLQSYTINVTIRPRPTAAATVPSSTICNATSAGIVLDGNITDASTTFGWTRSVNANVTSSQGSGSSGAIAAIATYTIPDVLTNTAVTAQTVTYTITPSSNGCSGTAITVTITVAPAVTAGTIAANQTICSGGSPLAFTQSAATGVGTISYQWQSSTTGISGSYSPISGATSPTYTPTGVTVNTWYIRTATSLSSGATPPIVTGVTYTSNSASCSQNTSSISIIINSVNPGSIAGTQTICSGGDPVAFTSVDATSAGTITYQWESSTTDCSSGFSDIMVNGTSPTYDVPSGLTVTTYFRRKAISTLNTIACNDYSNCITVFVNDVTAGTIGNDQTICGNNPSAFTVITPATGLGSLSYQWQSNTTGCGGSWGNIIGAIGVTYDPPPGLLVTTYYRRITTSTLNGIPCSASGNCITVTANSVTAGVISGNRTVCSGGDPTAFTETTPATGTGLSYQWQYSLTSGAGPWTDVPGAIGVTYDAPGPISQNTYYQRQVKASVNGTDCFAYSNFITVFVNNVTPSTVAGNQTLCSNLDPVAFTVTTAAIGTGSLTYQWQSNTSGCGGSWADISGATSATYNPPAVTQTTYFQVRVTSTLNTINCSAFSNCIEVTSFGKTWNGSVNEDWSNASNWTPSGVPDSTHCVSIPNVTNDPEINISNAYAYSITVLNGGYLEVDSNNTITVTDIVSVNAGGLFTIENNASLIQINNVVNNGTITYQRIAQQKRLDYVYWSSPVENFNISSHPSNGFKYSWNTTFSNANGTQGNWQTTSGIMNAGQGYIVGGPNWFNNAANQNLLASFIGVPRNGNISITINRGSNNSGTTYTLPSGAQVTTLDDNWNLLGNPYPSAISCRDFLTLNTSVLTGALYIWSHGNLPSTFIGSPFYSNFVSNYNPIDYIPFNLTGNLANPNPDYYIGACQGFFVTMIDGASGSGTVNFNNSLRNNTYGNSTGANFLRTPNTTETENAESNRIWLELNKNNQAVRTLVGYVSGATMENDNLFDAISKRDNSLKIFSLTDEDKFIIQGRSLPFDAMDQVKIGIDTYEDGQYSIALAMVDGLFLNTIQNIFLEDKLLNVIHNLRQAPYNFTTTTGTFTERFVLRYTDASLGNPTQETDTTFAYITNHTLKIQSTEDIKEITIYDISGKLFKTYKIDSPSNHFEKEFPYANGVYIATIKLINDIIVSKKLVH